MTCERECPTGVGRGLQGRGRGCDKGAIRVAKSSSGRCHGRGRGFEPRRPRHTFQRTCGMIWHKKFGETGCKLGEFCTQFAPNLPARSNLASIFKGLALNRGANVTEKRKPTT